MLLTNIGFVGLPYLQKAATYDPIKEFVPIATVADGPAYIYVNSSVPAHDMGEFIAWAKTKPEGVEFATSGRGWKPYVDASAGEEDWLEPDSRAL